MTIQQQKINFLNSAKGKKAVAYCNQLFADFVPNKLEPGFLQWFYADFNGFGEAWPVKEEKKFSDYELLFWFWFYKRLDRAQREHEIYLDNIAYEKLKKELESENPLNSIPDFISGLFKDAKTILLVGGGLFLAYKLFWKK